jgi:hypothetical protein
MVAAEEKIIGYLVYLVNNEVTAQDILYQNRILYPKWEDATAAAAVLAQTSTRPICLLRSTSQSNCHAYGYTTAYRLDSADVVIFPIATPGSRHNT